MKKGILLSLVAVMFVGVIIFAIWYINEDGKIRVGSREAFVPYNSALVVNVNAGARLPAAVDSVFAQDIQVFRRKLLMRVVDTLRNQGFVMSKPYALAARVEGKSDIRLLYVLDHKDVLSRNEMAEFLNQAFAEGNEEVRKYDHHKIYTLKQGNEEVYFTICGGILLVSDSDLYIEDGLKQFDLVESGENIKPHYQNLTKYFSADAGINVFLNSSAFTEILPLYVQVKKLFPHLDITRFFKWGALDGELNQQGICLNGFMCYDGLELSYMRTLQQQQARESTIEGVIPSHIMSLGMLNLNDLSAYFAGLENYRYSVGLKEDVAARKRQFLKMFGEEREEEMRSLLQGEFAVVDFPFQEADRERDGLVVVSLKSGGLCQMLIDKMMKSYAHLNGQDVKDYQRRYSIDREKAFSYYRFPAEDLAAVYWGYLFEGIQNRYVMVEDNYLIFASSEEGVKNFIKAYVHSDFIKDAEWYRNLRRKLSGKCNLSYFAKTADVLPFYKSLLVENKRDSLGSWVKGFSVFPTFALQWSNEGKLLYHTFLLSTEEAKNDVRPSVLWQTKVDARVSMKPIPVINYVTGEREVLVQDDSNQVYLINDAGRILWKISVEGRINSEIYQIDVLKNGKLQYLFSTAVKMYLIDRNGDAVDRFPVTFQEKCEQGITMFDYDHNRDYRIFAPCADQKVYLYGQDGRLVDGWEARKTDKPIVTKVEHYRLSDKDYIVFADRYRLYILDRRGQERVRVSSVFDLKEQTDIYEAKRGGESVFVFAGRDGVVNMVNLVGKVDTFHLALNSGKWQMNVADVVGDGTDQCILTDGNRLSVYRMNGKLLYEKDVDAQSLDYPYVYRFSASDIRVGLTDREQEQMLLLDADGNLSNGFPISGDSPFSIVFFGNDGFFLFAGANNGTVIKYKVQR
ncbi:MAG: WD40 repeat domain-containing protein [Odoribacter sp.]